MKKLRMWAATAALLASAAAAQAALVNLGDGTVSDTDTHLIWLLDWNVNGRANWATQVAWAQDLDFAGSTEWRLPTAAEYRAYLFRPGISVSVVKNLQFTDLYWTADSASADFATAFDPARGGTGGRAVSDLYFAVAVRSADAAATVPEPQTLALALIALGATAAARRARRR